MTFYQYLSTLKDEDSPAGDLARSGAYDALDSAWRRYRAELRRKSRFT